RPGARPPAPSGSLSRRSQTGAGAQPRALGERVRTDLLTARGTDPCHLDLSAGRRDRDSCVVDGGDLSRPPGRAADELARVVELDDGALMSRPRPRLRIGAADQVPDLPERLLPVDLDVLLRAPALVRRLALVLNDPGRVARTHQVHAFEQRGYA